MGSNALDWPQCDSEYLQQKAVLDAQDSKALQAAKSSSPPAVKKGTSDLVAEENVDQQL
eukprot:gene15694-11233_t